jgi:diguanylate cyclase (GGDEF)-like protein/PAS domain S-box-containing protein
MLRMLDLSAEITRSESAEAALARLNREFRAIRSCHRTLMRAVDEPTLLAEICRIVCDEAGYRMAWVGYAERDADKTVRKAASAGDDDGYLEQAAITWADVERGRGPCGIAIRTGATFWVQDFANDPRVAPWRVAALARGFLGGAALPLKDETGGVFGVFCLYAREANALTLEEIRLLEALAADVALGIVVLRQRAARARAETQLRALVQTIPDVVWTKDIEGRYTRCNPTLERVNGWTEREIVGKTDYDLAPHELAEAYRKGDLTAIESGAVHSAQFETIMADGQIALFEVLKAPLRDEAGQTTGVIGVARNISDRRKADEDQRIAAIAFEAQEAILIIDDNGAVLRVNQAYSEMTGYMALDVVGKSMAEIADSPGAERRFAEIVESVAREGAWRGEYSSRRKSGEVFPAWVTVAKVTAECGKITHYVATMTDLAERRRAEREIETLAYYDRLTGLPNRRLFLERLQQALAGSQRSGRKGALLFIDLDNFKLLNDTSGHESGDQLLSEVARRLIATVGGAAARVGGDEFVALLEDLSDDASEAAALAKRTGEAILAALNTPYALARGVANSSPSIGVVVFSDGSASSHELLKQADIAMYAAKAAGRNTLRFFDPEVQAALAARGETEAALRLAVRDEAFVLHYQPQVDSYGEWIGAEALLRWAHPERGLVAPGEFIPLAEETGLIVPIGRWVLRTACETLRGWADDRRTGDLHLSVNVSARQFNQADFVAEVDEALRVTGAPAGRLVLELTESVVLDDLDGAVGKMNALKALGVRFALDDFGTGYSSLAYVARLPLDQIKIDRGFVRNLPASVNDAAVAHTIITLAESLGLGVIAEGVETEGQRLFLERHGCPQFQGFLFAKPMPRDAFEERLS